MGARAAAQGFVAIARTGVLRPPRPDRMLRMVREARKWGTSVAAVTALSAARYPGRTAIVDAQGTLSWAELESRTNQAAVALAERGVGPGSTIGILCRNHRGFVEAVVSAAKLGADALLLNTGFAGPQLGEVARREGVTHLVHDEHFGPQVAASGLEGEIECYVTWPEQPGGEPLSFDQLTCAAGGDALEPPERPGEVVILSSGTTGTPKGAKRNIDPEQVRRSGGAAASLGMITQLPLRAGEPTLISAPLFHTWGFSHLLICAAMSSPMILRERFSPADALATIAAQHARALVAVPAMLQRILDLPDGEREQHDTSSLRLVALSGSALPGGLATRWMDRFGENLYSLYGSTEVSAVAIAGPRDLRSAPETAGSVVGGVEVRLLDAGGRDVKPGDTGRVFVRSGMLFAGYTGGESKEVVDGFMSTGDLGHFDAGGRLFIDGREDDMIVSGGENVFPQEVEEVILRHPGVRDAVAVGVADDEFGQRLVAFVVPRQADTPPSEDEIKEWVRGALARYKVPREVHLRDELPRNTTGKLLRRVLAAEVSEGR